MTLGASELSRFAAALLGAAEESAALVAAGYRSRPVADLKGKSDLVTDFDRASEELLAKRLAAIAPGVPVVGEEHATAGEASTLPAEGSVLYVDPLDGTTNFVHGHPFWCVAIGLFSDGVPAAGAVVAPSLSLAWTGWFAGGAGEARRNGERCRPSSVAELSASLVATGFPPMREQSPENNFDSFVAVKRASQAVRRCGSAAIDLCMVADGTYDAYWERRLHAWDTVGAGAIVLGAGGRVTALDGGPPRWQVGHIVASNGLVHDAVVDALAESERQGRPLVGRRRRPRARGRSASRSAGGRRSER